MKRRLSLLVLPALLFATALAPAPAQATDQHLYDPVLSLNGATTTIADDLVPDPGPNHPPKGFEVPCGTVTDSHGDIYVASGATNNEGQGPNGRIDVFDPQGRFLVEIKNEHQPCSLAVDSQGNLYVKEVDSRGGSFGSYFIDRYEPDSYPPASSTIYTPATPFEFVKKTGCSSPEAIAVDPSNDHLYIEHSCRVEEYASAEEGSVLIDEEAAVPQKGSFFDLGLDVSGKNHDIYASVVKGDVLAPKAVLVFDGTDAHVKCEVLGTEGPEGEPEPFKWLLSAPIAVDQANGDFYVYDYEAKAVDQFSVQGEECGFVGKLPSKPPTLSSFGLAEDLAVDDPIEAGEEGYDSPNAGYVYVTSGTTAKAFHLFAFRPRLAGAPEIKATEASEIGQGEALLEAELKPNGLATSYHFEYTTEAAFDEHGFEGATAVPVPDAALPASGAFEAVSEPISGLQAGAAYRFRLVASNCEAEGAIEGECLTDGEDASFATYPAPPVSPPCPNAALRTGRSATLPDCRAYELVTPADTNGRIPTMGMLGEGYGDIAFDTTMASPDGASLVFGSNSGSLPGVGGGGFQDTFEARRDPAAGWQSAFAGLESAQADKPHPGGISADHRYAFWNTGNLEGEHGTLIEPGAKGGANYLRVPVGTEHAPNCMPEAEPEGRFEWLGCGSEGFEPEARGKWIGPGGRVVFATNTANNSPARRLEPCAPPTGTPAIYERTPGGPTRCVSFLPGDVTPGAGLAADFRAAAADGSAIAFAIDHELYVRRDAETVEVAGGNPIFGGISADGGRVFYVTGGDIFACDVGEGACAGPEASHAPIQIGSGGESTLVNVAEEGSAAYFVSKAKLTGEEDNGHGVKAKAGEENLYVWDGEAVRFVAIVSPADVEGEDGFGGLGLWTSHAFNPGIGTGPADDPSRTNPSGTALVFESAAYLTPPYESDGHREIYRYDATAEGAARLICVSCTPTGAPPSSDALLQSQGPGSPISEALPPLNSSVHIANVSADGSEVFFQS